MHVMAMDGSNTQLYRNSTYHKTRAKTDINIVRSKHKPQTYPFAVIIMIQLKSLEVTTTDILQLSLKKLKISRI